MADENKRLRMLDPSIKLDTETRRQLNKIFDAIDDELKSLQLQVTTIKNRIDTAGIP